MFLGGLYLCLPSLKFCYVSSSEFTTFHSKVHDFSTLGFPEFFSASFSVPNASASKSASFPPGVQDLKKNFRENVKKASAKFTILVFYARTFKFSFYFFKTCSINLLSLHLFFTDVPVMLLNASCSRCLLDFSTLGYFSVSFSVPNASASKSARISRPKK